MEFITGKMVGFTKAISTTTSEMASVSYIMEIKWSIEDTGKMDNKLINK